MWCVNCGWFCGPDKVISKTESRRNGEVLDQLAEQTEFVLPAEVVDYSVLLETYLRNEITLGQFNEALADFASIPSEPK